MPSNRHLLGTLTPFLYPFLSPRTARSIPQFVQRLHLSTTCRARQSTFEQLEAEQDEPAIDHLNPPPSDYSRTIFADRATVTLHAGGGGHGCISFVREKYIPAGPANGGDGGTGGNIYIQAVRGETSLHKLARRTMIKAGRGRNGRGKTRGGERGSDVVITVPVGTIIREIERHDPIAQEEELRKLQAGKEDGEITGEGHKGPYKWSREKWLLYPAITPEDIASAEFPSYPKPRRSALAMSQPEAPINLDLSKPMEGPMLLLAGAGGGLGNPHFVTREVPRPKYATKGAEGTSITITLELKLLADVGLVGLPNAGKSTLLRSISNSRARVGNWAFTTLQPNIGTVVLDTQKGRPLYSSSYETGEPRTAFTIADIPGLVKDAHLDRGLGISFLRHVERARVLAFVIDLNAGNAVEALKSLWKEVGMYERLKISEDEDKKEMTVEWTPFQSVEDALANRSEIISMKSPKSGHGNVPGPAVPSIAKRPWFVIATKADLPETMDRFMELRQYLRAVQTGIEEHPSGQAGGWIERLEVIPISAINGHGVDKVTEHIVGLLDE